MDEFFDDDRGVPPVSYEEAYADALKEAMPVLRLLASGRTVLSPEHFEVLTELVDEELRLIANEHGDRTSDLDATADIFDDLKAYQVEEEA